MHWEVTRQSKSMSILATALVLAVSLPAVSLAVPCADLPQSVGKAAVHRAPCEGAPSQLPDGLTGEDLPAAGLKGVDDVVGAEIFSVDSMVKTSLAAPGTLTPFSALPSGTGPGGGLVQGCDFDAAGGFGTLYCIEGSGGFFTVDTTTGAQSLVGVAAVVAPDAVVTGLASDPTTGIMYMVATSESSPGSGDCATDSGLYTLDLGTGAATRVGAIPDLSCVIAAGFDNSGQLYAYGVVNDNLVSIDKATGNSTIVGPLGFNPNFAQGMDFDAATNTCYLFAYNDDASSGSEGQLMSCDTTTGTATFVAFLGAGNAEVSGVGIATVNAGAIFSDGFESGNTSTWSSTTP